MSFRCLTSGPASHCPVGATSIRTTFTLLAFLPRLGHGGAVHDTFEKGVPWGGGSQSNAHSGVFAAGKRTAGHLRSTPVAISG